MEAGHRVGGSGRGGWVEGEVKLRSSEKQVGRNLPWAEVDHRGPSIVLASVAEHMSHSGLIQFWQKQLLSRIERTI